MNSFMKLCSLSDLSLMSRELYQEFLSGCRSDMHRFDLKKKAKKIVVPSYEVVVCEESFEDLPHIGPVTMHYLCKRGEVVLGSATIRLYGTTAVFDPTDLVEFE